MAAAALLLLLSAPSITFAGSATWSPAPGSGDWNTAGNWVAGGPPNGPADTATFAISTQTAVSISANTEVNSIVFNAGASAFTITASPGFVLTISGVGITNNSGVTQNFVPAPQGTSNGGIIEFTNSATAGSLTAFTNNGATVSGGLGAFTEFFNTSTASTGIFVNNGATVSGAGGGFTTFFDTSTAGNGTFTNNGGTVSGANGGLTQFLNTSTAGNGTFTNNGATVSGGRGGVTGFDDTSTAGAATLIANGGTGGGGGGTIFFTSDSTGGTARVEVFGNGNLDISAHNAPGVTVGSIEGSGNVFLGANNLTVGSNNLSTTFSGVIQDGGFNGGAGGSLTKIGTGTLSLTNSNTYSGGTLINAGTLIAAHDGALGSGNVSLTAAGVTLTLQSGATNNYISDHSSISIVNGATANLNFTGASDVVGGIVLNGFNETTPGTYGSATSGAMFESVFFSGTGTLLLVPEPATWTLMVLGMAMLTVMRFRRPRS